jgi:hypothetical protein
MDGRYLVGVIEPSRTQVARIVFAKLVIADAAGDELVALGTKASVSLLPPTSDPSGSERFVVGRGVFAIENDTDQDDPEDWSKAG